MDQILLLDWYKSASNGGVNGICPDMQVTYYSTVNSSIINQVKEKILFESVQKLTWAFNIEFTKKDLSSFKKIFNN